MFHVEPGVADSAVSTRIHPMTKAETDPASL